MDSVVELLKITHDTRILDIGIGTGLLSERIPKGVDLYGIDVSEKMMDQVRKKGLNATLKTGHFPDIPFEDNLFNCAVSTFAFHHVPEELKIAAFGEICRILKPDGQLILADFMMENQIQRAELEEQFRREGRKDMILELEKEHFTEISVAKDYFEDRRFLVSYKRASTLSWIFIATGLGAPFD